MDSSIGELIKTKIQNMGLGAYFYYVDMKLSTFFYKLSRAETSWDEPSWAELSRAEMRQAEPSWGKLRQAELSWAELSQ